MTDGERELIVRRLEDRGLLPYDGAEYYDKGLTARELRVLDEEVERDARRMLREMNAELAASDLAGLARLKRQLRLLWLSLLLTLVWQVLTGLHNLGAKLDAIIDRRP